MVYIKEGLFKYRNLPANESLFDPTYFKLLPCTPADLDFNLHKSNATYAVDLDFARSELLFAKFRKNIRHSFSTYMPLASTNYRFFKSVAPFESVTIESRILYYDKKWLFMLSRFLGHNNELKCSAISRYVFKQGRKTIDPRQIVEGCGFDVDEVLLAKGRKLANDILDLDSVREIQ